MTIAQLLSRSRRHATTHFPAIKEFSHSRLLIYPTPRKKKFRGGTTTTTTTNLSSIISQDWLNVERSAIDHNHHKNREIIDFLSFLSVRFSFGKSKIVRPNQDGQSLAVTSAVTPSLKWKRNVLSFELSIIYTTLVPHQIASWWLSLLLPFFSLPSSFSVWLLHVCCVYIIQNTSQLPSLDRTTNDNIRKKNMDTSENIQLRWREKTHFYSNGSYEIWIQGFGEMERFHLTFVGVRKIDKQFHLSKSSLIPALYPNFVATIRIEMGLFPPTQLDIFTCNIILFSKNVWLNHFELMNDARILMHASSSCTHASDDHCQFNSKYFKVTQF